MNLELKPIKKLITIAFVLHMVSLCVATILFMLQVQIRNFMVGTYGSFLRPGEDEFVFLPPIFIVLIVIVFVFHCGLTVGFWKAISSENPMKRLRFIGRLSFVFVLIVFPLLISMYDAQIVLVQAEYHAHWVSEDWTLAGSWPALNILRTLDYINVALIFRNLAISILLIATSMSWYCCFTKKAKENRIE